MSRERAMDWLHQAEDDFRWAEDSLKSKHYYGVCFLAQQIAEKALKAVSFYRAFDQVRSHSVLSICMALKINGDLEKKARILDQYYISTRYPDGLPGGHAGMFYTEEQATEALQNAAKFLDFANQELKV